MIPALRAEYNARFTPEKYRRFISELSQIYPGQLDFRVAETPVFVPRDLKMKILETCEYILDVVLTPEYARESLNAVPAHLHVPGDPGRPECIAFDFGVCEDENGGIVPMLIEMQGFPSLFAWQQKLPEIHKLYFEQPSGTAIYPGDMTRESYVQMLREVIIGNADPAHVILLEVLPETQKTRVDFHATYELLGIETVCLTRLIRKGSRLYYNRNGMLTPVERIFNRVIFDELLQQPEEIMKKLELFTGDTDVKWIPHPDWFYRLSKYTLPSLDHKYVPTTSFLKKNQLPDDLENHVVKPLFSFAGQGIIIDPTREEIDRIPDPQNWIIQHKVQYAPVIQTPGEPAKAEIRIFYLWPPGASRPVPANNLARLSKGKMIGVRYNKNKDWVGGTFCLFEK